MDAAAVSDIFAAFGTVRCRRMFGGLGVYAEGVMFALVADDRLYLKTDPAFAMELAARGAVPFVYEARGRRVTVAYWSLPDDALDDAEAAAQFARRALAIAVAAPIRRRPRR